MIDFGRWLGGSGDDDEEDQNPVTKALSLLGTPFGGPSTEPAAPLRPQYQGPSYAQPRLPEPEPTPPVRDDWAQPEVATPEPEPAAPFRPQYSGPSYAQPRLDEPLPPGVTAGNAIASGVGGVALDRVIKPVLETIDAANEWVINNPYTGAVSLPAMGRELAGMDQFAAEVGADQARLGELADRYRAGDRSVEEEMLALEADVNRRLEVGRDYRERLLEAGKRNPNKAAETAGGIGQAAAATALAPGLSAGVARNIGAAVIDPAGQALGAALELPGRAIEAVGPAVRGVRSALDANAERVAAADARMAAEGSTLLPGSAIFRPDPLEHGEMVVPSRRPKDAVPASLADDEHPLFLGAATALRNNTAIPQGAQVEWRPVGIDIKNKGQYDGQHVVQVPFYHTQTDEWIPLPWADMGGMGTPGNSAYSKAVSVSGGRKGSPYGAWRDVSGTEHPYDSPQEIIYMAELDRLKQSGMIRDWWRGKTGRMPNLESVPYVSTNRDKGGVRAYEADFFVQNLDDSLEVWEAKPAKVIASAEEYGTKANKVTGKMGWDVTKKAAGIISYLADEGVAYRLKLQRDSSRILGEFSQRAGAKTSKDWSSVPGVDPRDLPSLLKKSLSPEATSLGNRVADTINQTSDEAVELAAALKAQGLSDQDRLAALTEFVRGKLLPTADELGRYEGQTRNLTMGTRAELAAGISHRGALTLDELAELDPDTAEILRDARVRGLQVGPLAIHDAPLPDGTMAPHLFYDGTGDPQLAIRAAALVGQRERSAAAGLSDIAARRLGQRAQASERAAAIWYHDAKGPYRASTLGVTVPEGSSLDIPAIQQVVADLGADAPILHPRYNSGTHAFEGFELLGRRADGSVIPENDLGGVVTLLEDAVRAQGAEPVNLGHAKAEYSGFSGIGPGEVGHAPNQSAALERSEQILGLRPVPRPARSALAGAEGAGPGARGPVGEGAESGAEAVGRDRGPLPDDLDEFDDLDPDDPDDALLAGVRLIGPFPPGYRPPQGRQYATGATGGTGTLGTFNRAAGQAIMSGVSGAVGSQVAEIANPEDPYAGTKGFLAGAVGLPLLGRGAGMAARLAGAGPPSPGGLRAAFGAMPEMGPTRTQGQLGMPGLEADPLRQGASGVRPAGSDALEQFPQAAEVARKSGASVALSPAGTPGLHPVRWLAELAGQAMYSSMLGPGTMVFNMFQNAWEPSTSIVREPARAVMRARQTGNTAALREPGQMAAGAAYGLQQVWPAIKEVIKGEGKYAPNPNAPALSSRTVNPLARLLPQALEAPGRAWSGLPDAVFGTVMEHAGQAREAGQIATSKGLKGDAWKAEAARLLEDARAVIQQGELATSTEVQQVVDAGAALAKRTSLRDELGTIGKEVSKVAKLGNVPGVSTWLTPFFNTNWNGLLRQLEKTPAGFAMNTAPSTFDKNFDATLGSAVVLGIAGYGAHGGVTGSGPTDANQRKMMQKEGWQPYSVMVPRPGGGYLYVPNRYFPGFEAILNGAGELHDGMAYGKPGADTGERVTEAARRAGKLIQQNPYALSGIVSLLDMVEGGVAGGIAGQAAQFTPFAAVGRAIGTALDPSERAPARGPNVPFEQQVKERYAQSVGAREAVTPAQDVLGQPVANPRAGAWALVPKITTEQQDAVVSAFQESGLGIGPPRTDFTDDGVTFELSPAETQRWQQIRGEELTKRTQSMIDNGLLARLTPERRAERLAEIKADAADRADERLGREIGRPEVRRRRDEARTREKAAVTAGRGA